ncbi:MAG: RNase adapter RapZ [Rhodothalassiaceae bacterium]
MADTSRSRVLFVTGLSGAGKTTALKTLEDLGYDAVDNIPIALLPALLDLIDDNPAHEEPRPLAVGIDCRTRAFRADKVVEQIDVLRQRDDIEVAVLFFECNDETLAQRFSETRRRHPLALDRPIMDGITREREIMAPLRNRADFVFDTSGQSIADTRRRLKARYRLSAAQGLTLVVMSFGYSRGLPRDTDMLVDVRFLRNPHYVPDLKPGTGLDQAVADYVAGDESFQPFLDRMIDLLLFLLPRYRSEGKSYFTLGIGCTGGRHRSVYVAELIGHLLQRNGYRVTISHRDCDAAPAA